MYLNDYVDTMLKTTPTAYIIYQKIKNSNNEIINYKVLDYNPSFLNIIDKQSDTEEVDKFGSFILNMTSEIPRLNKSILKSQHKHVTAYSHIYKKWLNAYLFFPDEDKIIIQIIDVTKEKQLEKKLRKKSQELQRLINVINDLLLVIDLDENIYLANKMCGSLLGLNQYDLIGQSIFNFLTPQSYNTIVSSFKNKSPSKSSNIVRTEIKTQDRETLDIEWNCSIYEGYVFLAGRDITDIIETQEKILYLSYHDTLTGLYNRSFFEEELKRLDNDRNLPLSIIMGDVNGLKITNDVFGHFIGDKLLKDIANILKLSIRKGDILSRWGGDEFVMLLPNTNEETTREIIKRIHSNLKAQKTDLKYASISLGYSIKTSPDQDIYDILTHAENYMYKNKSIEGKIFRKEILSSLASSLDSMEYEKHSNLSRVKVYLDKFSKLLKLSSNQTRKLFLLAEMHDIGLIAVPKEIMNKKEPLTNFDWDEIKRHPETGFRIAKSIPELSEIANNILYHHERYDGKGYPHGLSGEDIPYLNRIFSIVDVYSALSEKKIYRDSFSNKEIIKLMKKDRAHAFDPEILDLFLSILEEKAKL